MTREEIDEIVAAAKTPDELLKACDILVEYAKAINRRTVRWFWGQVILMTSAILVAIAMRHFDWAPVCP